MKVVNLTPHPITITDGPTFEPSGTVARVSTDQKLVDIVNGIDVSEQTFGDIEGLPSPSYFEDTIYIVSAVVLAAAKAEGRTDCVAPNTAKAVRNEDGHIVVPGFVK